MNRRYGRFRRIDLPGRGRNPAPAEGVALDDLHRDIKMPSLVRLLREMENLDDMIPDGEESMKI